MILKLRYLTIFLDYLLLLGAFVLAYFMRVGFIFSSDFPFGPYFNASLIAAAAWIISLIIFRGYSPNVRFNRFIHFLKVVVSGVTGTAAFGLIFYFTEKELFSRLLLVYMFGFGSAVMALFHLLMLGMERHLIGKGYGITRLLIIGSNRGVKSLISTLKQNRSPYLPVAILDGYGTSQKEIEGVPVLGKLNILEETVEKQRIDAIVQGDNIEQVVNIQSFCQQQGLDYYLLPYLLGTYQDNLRIQYMETALITPDKDSPRRFWEKLLG
ncbi:MAG: nucleoside-diphosphate sugar epimerase/dehydratase [Candidatus Altimarinota bacterium]